MPGPPYSADKVAGRIIMVRCGETQNSGHGVLCGTRDEELTILGDVQAQKAAELLMDIRVGCLPLQGLRVWGSAPGSCALWLAGRQAGAGIPSVRGRAQVAEAAELLLSSSCPAVGSGKGGGAGDRVQGAWDGLLGHPK